MREPKRDARRIVGVALVASAAIMVIVAGLVGLRLLPVADEVRPVLAGILAVAGLVDGAIGMKLLTTIRP